MGIRELFVSSAMAFLLASALPVTPVGAADGTPCTMELDLTTSPGLSASPSSGTFTSNGETGTISCNGPVNGRQPDRPGHDRGGRALRRQEAVRLIRVRARGCGPSVVCIRHHADRRGAG